MEQSLKLFRCASAPSTATLFGGGGSTLSLSSSSLSSFDSPSYGSNSSLETFEATPTTQSDIVQRTVAFWKGILNVQLTNIARYWVHTSQCTQEFLFQIFRAILEAPMDFEIHHDHLKLFTEHDYEGAKILTLPFSLVQDDVNSFKSLSELLLIASEVAFVKNWDSIAYATSTSYTRFKFNAEVDNELAPLRLDLARAYAVVFASIAAEDSRNDRFVDIKIMMKAAAERYELSLLKRSRNAFGTLAFSAMGERLSENERSTHERCLTSSSSLHNFISTDVTKQNLILHRSQEDCNGGELAGGLASW